MLKEWEEFGSHLYPSAVINDQTFRGQLNTYNLYEALCASMDEKSPQCERWLNRKGIELDKTPRGGVDSTTLRIIVLLLVILNLALVFFYRRCLNKELEDDMKMQVSSAVS
jgi:hypothetical protein